MYNKEDRAVANDRFRAIMKQIQKLDQEEEFKSACFGTTEKYRNEITKLRIQIAELQTKVDLYEKYISYCADFDPQVTQGPEQLETGYGGIVLCGDTYVECKHRHRCKTIYEYLKNEKDKK